MGEAFQAKVKEYNGNVDPCVVCQETPKVGDVLWMQNIGTETEKRWIFSPHAACFEKIQKEPDKYQPKKEGGGSGKSWGGKGTTINNIEDVEKQVARSNHFIQSIPVLVTIFDKIDHDHKSTQGMSLGQFLRLNAEVLLGKSLETPKP